ncbi:glucosamine-6-phosphate isomerase [[Eubacterium] cellulosolvens]
MPRFKGVVQRVTLSNEDLEKLLTIPPKEIDAWSPVKVVILKDQKTLYETFARSIAGKIKKNNEANRPTKLILPVGPTPQFPILAEICNKEKISWKNVWTFNMDEYLDWEGRPIPPDHPMSFKGYMHRSLFNRLDPEIRIPPEQTWFPDPFNPDAIDQKISERGGVDTAYGGIGYHGHIAFNEPVDTYYIRLTPEEFKNAKSRVVNLNTDTFVINSLCGIGGNPYGLPPKAVTLGMKPILGAKTIELYCDGGDLNWQLATFRVACMHPPTLDRPATFVQEHPNPKETVTIYADQRTAAPIKISPK